MIDLITCPYCNAEYKKITANHLVKHNIKYLDYLKEYDKNKYYLKVLSEFIWEFYRPCTNKYIEQVYSKETHGFIWITKYAMGKDILEKEIIKAQKEAVESSRLNKLSNTRGYPFTKSDIVQHLRKERTLGIYTYNGDTTFLTFDIDEDNMDYVLSICNSLKRCNIDENQILLTYSGNKGYHISIFFNKPILIKKVKEMFDLFLWTIRGINKLRENGSKVVEARGVSNQAVKIPFSINRKNTVEYRKINNWNDLQLRMKEGKGNYCYAIDEYGCEIDTLDKITHMQKVDSSMVDRIINDLTDDMAFFDNLCRYEISLNDSIKKIEIDSFSINKNVVYEGIEALLDKPIEVKERHTTLLKIAIYNKSYNMTAKENEDFLINFTTDKKMNHKFETKIDVNIKEIKSIIRTIYYSETADKYRIYDGIKKLSFTKDEILEILSIKDKHLRKFYFIMFTQFKMFGNKRDKRFFLTYERIKKSVRINGKAINDKLLQLEKLNKIVFVRKGEKDNGVEKIRNKPNIYMLKYNLNSDETDKGYKLLRGDKEANDNITFCNFEMMCAKVLSKVEIETHFCMQKTILKYKYQKLVEV
jgi:hypothetical protein